MSVAFTEDAVRARTKTVTRRAGWWVNKAGRRLLLPGNHLVLCKKVMGRRRGEPLERICEVEVVDVRREELGAIYDEEHGVALEGFPAMTPGEFIDRFFVTAQGIHPWQEVTRIQWRYLEEAPR